MWIILIAIASFFVGYIAHSLSKNEKGEKIFLRGYNSAIDDMRMLLQNEQKDSNPTKTEVVDLRERLKDGDPRKRHKYETNKK